MCCFLTGTHDIINCTTSQDSESVTIVVNFKERSEATGALLSFIFVREDGSSIDFSKTISLTANKSSVSQGLMLPMNRLYPGLYMLYVYDIESSMKLMEGLQYPANSTQFRIMNDQGKP